MNLNNTGGKVLELFLLLLPVLLHLFHIGIFGLERNNASVTPVKSSLRPQSRREQNRTCMLGDAGHPSPLPLIVGGVVTFVLVQVFLTTRQGAHHHMKKATPHTITTRYPTKPRSHARLYAPRRIVP